MMVLVKMRKELFKQILMEKEKKRRAAVQASRAGKTSLRQKNFTGPVGESSEDMRVGEWELDVHTLKKKKCWRPMTFGEELKKLWIVEWGEGNFLCC